MKTLEEFSQQSGAKDPLENLRKYNGYVQLELYKKGAYTPELAQSAAEVLIQHGVDQGIEMGEDPVAAFVSPVEFDDTDAVSRYAEDEGIQDAARTLKALRDPKVSSAYSDPAEYQTRLEAATRSYTEAASPDVRNKAKRAALSNGDLPFAIMEDVIDGQPVRSLEVSPALAALAGDNEAIAAEFESNPDLDLSVLPDVINELTVPDGYAVPRATFRRQQDFSEAVAALDADSTVGFRINDLIRSVSREREGNIDVRLDRAVEDLSNYGFDDFSKEERKAFLLDMAVRNGSPEVDFDETEPQKYLRTLSTGEIVAPKTLMYNENLFNKALEQGDIPEAQKENLRFARESQMEAMAPDLVKNLSDYFDDEFRDFYEERATRDEKGVRKVKDSEIVSEFLTDSDRFSSFKAYAAGFAEAVAEGFGGLVLHPMALAGNDIAKDMLTTLQKSDAERRAAAQLFGKDLGIGYDLTRIAAPIAADITVSVATGGLATAAVAGKWSLKTAMRNTIKTALSAESKNLVKSYGARLAGAETLTASKTLNLIGQDLSKKFVKSAVTASYLATAFNRSAGATYIGLSSQLSQQTNADGTPKYSEQEVRDIALKHGVFAGTITAAVTGAFSFMGAAGMERVYSGMTRKQMGRVFERVKRDFGRIPPEIAKDLNMETPEKFIASAVVAGLRKNAVSGGKAMLEEAPEEAIDQFLNYFNEKFATGDSINIVDAVKEAGYAGLLGGIMGGGVVGGRSLFSKQDPNVGQERNARRDLLLDSARRADEAGSPKTATALRQMAFRGIPRPAAPVTTAPQTDGQPATTEAARAQEGVPQEAPPAGTQPPSGVPVVGPQGEAPPVTEEAPATGDSGRRAASATRLANALASAYGLDIKTIQPSGQGATVTPNDVRKAAESLPATTSESGGPAIGVSFELPPEPTLLEAMGSRVSYEGYQGVLSMEEGRPVIETSEGTIIEVPSSVISDQAVSTLGIKITGNPEADRETVIRTFGDTEQESFVNIFSGIDSNTDQILDAAELGVSLRKVKGQKPVPVRNTPEFARKYAGITDEQILLAEEQIQQAIAETQNQPNLSNENKNLILEKFQGDLVNLALLTEARDTWQRQRISSPPLGNATQPREDSGPAIAPEELEAESTPEGELLPTASAEARLAAAEAPPAPAEPVGGEEPTIDVSDVFTPDVPEDAPLPETGYKILSSPATSGEVEAAMTDETTDALVREYAAAKGVPDADKLSARTVASLVSEELQNDPIITVMSKTQPKVAQSKVAVTEAIDALPDTGASRFRKADLRRALKVAKTLDQVNDVMAAVAGGSVRFQREPLGRVESELEAYELSQGTAKFLDNVSKRGPKNLRKIAALLKGFPDIQINFAHMAGSNWNGVYIPETGGVLINTARANQRGPIDTVVHELIHAALLDSTANPTPEQARVIRRINSIRSNVAKQAKAKGVFKGNLEYGLGSVDEFITHFLTSEKFQNQVNNLFKGDKSVIRALWEAITALLNGRSPQNQIGPDLMQDLFTFVGEAKQFHRSAPARMDVLMSMSENARNVARFNELTESLGRTPTPDQIEAFKQANPEAYAELESLRAEILGEAGYVEKVFHGTDKLFNRFSPTVGGKAWYGEGIYVTRSRVGASWYAGKTGFIFEGFAKFVNPRSISARDEVSGEQASGFSQDSIDQGFDAIEVTGRDDSANEVILFSPNQIKSADPLLLDDQGRLVTPDRWGDRESPDIRFSREDGEFGNKVTTDKGSPRAREIVRGMLTPQFRTVPEEYFRQDRVATPQQVALQNRIAAMYDALPIDGSSDPTVVEAYQRLGKEVLGQYQAITDAGFAVEMTNGSPYGSSEDMIADVDTNGRIKAQKTEPGSYGVEQETLSGINHPMLEPSGTTDVNGYPLLMNDVFRVVHDFIAHASYGASFGPLGEEAAWKAHMATLTDPLAMRALTTETRGQNSWVNYRDEYLGKDGMPLKKGDAGYVAPQNRPFADQKFALLPEEAMLTTEQDIRFSRESSGDAEYLAAVEAGDMATAQRMVDGAARAAGYDTNGYHQTWSDFTEFRLDENPTLDDLDRYVHQLVSPEKVTGKSGKAFFFSAEKGGGKANHNRKKTGEKELSVKIRMKSPLVMDRDTTEWAREVFGNGKREFPQILTDEARSRIQEEGYDGILLYDKKTLSSDSQPLEILSFDPNQIKSADPVTRDEAGNVIPLSQRFQPESQDIRFSRESAPDYTDPATIRAYADSIMPEGVAFSYAPEEVAEMLTDTAPFDAEDTIHALANRDIAISAAEKTIADADRDALSPRFRDTFHEVVSGNQRDTKRLGYRAEPDTLSKLVSYMKESLSAIWSRLEDRYDPVSAVAVDRLYKEIGDATRGYRVESVVRPFNPNGQEPLDSRFAVRFSRESSAEVPFYSQLQRVVEEKTPARATPEQIMATVKAAGVKAEEVKWSGIEQELERLALEGSGKIRKNDLLTYLDNAGSVKFEEVKLGGDFVQNRYETRTRFFDGFEGAGMWDTVISDWVWPNQEPMTWGEIENQVVKFNSGVPAPTEYSAYVLPGGEKYREVVLAETASPSLRYTSSHFPSIPNYIAHMRLNERTDAQGADGLFIEEIQSDRHQEGRKRGYRDDNDMQKKAERLKEMQPRMTELALKFIEGKTTAQETEEYNALRQEKTNLRTELGGTTLMGGNARGVADAPFRTTWPLAMFKRALRDAVESGKEWVGFSTAQPHIDRWGTERIEWAKQPDGSFLINAKSQHGGNAGGIDLEGEADARNLNPQNSKTVTTEAQLVEAIRPSLTEGQNPEALGAKLWKRMQTEGSGVSMPRKEGFEGFYDNMLPKEIGNYVKKWGAKVEKGETAGEEIWKIKVTPAMRESVISKGQVLFSRESAPDLKPSNPEFWRMTKFMDVWDGSRLMSAKQDVEAEMARLSALPENAALSDADILEQARLNVAETPVGWFGRMFGRRDDLRTKISNVEVTRKAWMAVQQNRQQNLNRKYEEAREKEGASDTLVSTALGTTASLLTPAAEDRINAEIDSRLEAINDTYKEARKQASAEKSRALRGEFNKAQLREAEAAYKEAIEIADGDKEFALAEVSAYKSGAISDATRTEAQRVRKEQDHALAELEANYPLTFQWTADIRDMIDEYQQRLAQWYGVSRPELAATIDNSNGVYLVRSYKFHQDPAMAEKILSDPSFEALRERAIGFFQKTLVDSRIENMKRLDPQFDEAMERDILNKNEDVMNQAKQNFQDWVAGHENTYMDRGSSNSDLRTQVERFMKQKNLPPEILELLGEIEDPLFNANKTLASLSSIAFNQKALATIREDGLAAGTMITEAEKNSNQRYKNWQPVVPIDKAMQSYAPLSGLYTSPEDKAAWDSVFNAMSNGAKGTAGRAYELLNKALVGSAGLSLGVMTLGSPGYYTRNIVGGMFVSMSQGVNPFSKRGWRSYQIAKKTILGVEDSDSEYSDELIAYRILADGIQVSYLQELTERYRENPINALKWAESKGIKIPEPAMEALRKGKAGQQAFLGKLQDWAEITETWQNTAIFEAEFEAMMRTGLYANERDAKQEAARRVKMVTASKSETSQGVREFTRQPIAALIAPFIRFKTEMFRTMANTYKLAWSDIKQGRETDNKALLDHGVKRLSSALIVHGGLTMLAPLLLQKLSDISDDEDDAVRSALPSYARNSSFLYLGKDKDGTIKTLDLTYTNLFSFAVDPLTRTISAVISRDFDEIPAIGARMVTQEILGENIVAGSVADVLRNSDESTGLPVYLQTDSDGDKIFKMASHIFNSSYNPAVVRKGQQAVQALYRPDKEDEDFFFTPVGIAVGSVLPTKARTHEVKDLARRSFRNLAAENRELSLITSKYKAPMGMSDNEVREAYDKRLAATRDINRRLKDHMAAFEELGLDRREVRRRAGDAGFSKERIFLTEKGRMRRPVFSPAFMKDVKEVDSQRLETLRGHIDTYTPYMLIE